MVTLSIETDKERQGHFRVPAHGLIKSIEWNGKQVRTDICTLADGQLNLTILDRPFTKAALKIEIE
jgi:hypothetical protein